jgi:hypothetical protein
MAEACSSERREFKDNGNNFRQTHTLTGSIRSANIKFLHQNSANESVHTVSQRKLSC